MSSDREKELEAVAQLKNLDEHWLHFRFADIAALAPDIQLHEMRQAFFAGAASALLLSAQRLKPWCSLQQIETLAKLNADIKRSSLSTPYLHKNESTH